MKTSLLRLVAIALALAFAPGGGISAQAPASTTTELYSIASPSSVNEPFTLSARVSSAAGVPTGEVEFFDGGTSLGRAALTTVDDVGVASVQFTADDPGPRALQARYFGDGDHEGSESPLLPHLVVPPPVSD